MALCVPPYPRAIHVWPVLALCFPMQSKHGNATCADGLRHAFLRKRWHTVRSTWALTAPTRSRAVPTWQTCWPSRVTRCGLERMSTDAIACSAQAGRLIPSSLAENLCKLPETCLSHPIATQCLLLPAIRPGRCCSLFQHDLASVSQPLPSALAVHYSRQLRIRATECDECGCKKS